MSNLTKKFQDIIKDIEKNITDEKQLEYINKKIAEISILHMEVIDEMADIIKNRITNVEQVQSSIENKLNKIQTSIAGIESDIYEDAFDFEIVCPYCNNEFTADIESKTVIRCPECNNVIELDWNGDDLAGNGCSGSCSNCGSKCNNSFLEEDNNEDLESYKFEEQDDDEDDDM